MSAKIVLFPGVTTLDLPPDRVLSRAGTAALASVVILGFREDGEFYFASSIANGPEALWLLELAKTRLIKIGDPA
jgi:hypothetical protein